MTSHAPDLSSLISTRICHDLINPIGAISNGLELLEEMQQQSGPEFGLITDSVASANAKLGFFRIAFGDAGPTSELPTALAAKTLNSMFANGRFKARWQVADDPVLRAHAKLVFLLVQSVDSSLPLGGNCTVTRQGDDWMIDGTGPRISPDEKLWNFLTRGEAIGELSSSDVHFAVARQTADKLGAKISMDAGAAGIAVRATV